MLEYQNIKNIFAKVYVPNWSEKVFVIKKVKTTVPWTYVISDLNGEEIVGMFYEKNCKKQIKKSLIIDCFSSIRNNFCTTIFF